jgi:hypothetical protein
MSERYGWTLRGPERIAAGDCSGTIEPAAAKCESGALLRARFIDGGVGGQQGSDDCAAYATDDGADSGADSPAAEKSMGFPRARGNARTGTSADARSDERVTQAVTAMHEPYAADVLFLEGAVAIGLGEHDGRLRNADEDAGMFLRGGVDDLNFSSRLQSRQVFSGGGVDLCRQRTGCGEEEEGGEQASHGWTFSLSVAASIACLSDRRIDGARGMCEECGRWNAVERGGRVGGRGFAWGFWGGGWRRMRGK